MTLLFNATKNDGHFSWQGCTLGTRGKTTAPKAFRNEPKMPEDTALASCKSSVNRRRGHRIKRVTRKNADRQTAFQLYIVEDIGCL